MPIFISLIVSIFLTLSAQANSLGVERTYDEFTGVYLSKDKKTKAFLTRVLVKEGDLLTPAQYDYILDIDDSIEPYPNLEDMILSYNEKSHSIFGEDSQECDDPGCMMLIQVDIDIAPNEEDRMTLKYDFEWFRFGDGYEDEDEGAGNRIAERLFKGVEVPLSDEEIEPLRSEFLKEKTFAAVEEGVKWIISTGTYRIDANLEDSHFEVYKKIYDGDQLEGLFVRTETMYTIPFREEENSWPGECFSLLVKERTWKVKYTDCSGGISDTRKYWL